MNAVESGQRGRRDQAGEGVPGSIDIRKEVALGFTRFILLVYRMPTKPTSARVAVWRQLKKVGAVYLQQSVCVFPDTARMRRELQPILAKVEGSAGGFHLFPLRRLGAADQAKLVSEFQGQTAKHYQEIIENCEINFQKEIEFESFRQNFTYEEAEEIRIEFEKIVSWFERVSDRDWFGAPNRDEALTWLTRCERLLEQFEERVFDAQAKAESGNDAPVRSPSRRHRPRNGRPLNRVLARGQQDTSRLA